MSQANYSKNYFDFASTKSAEDLNKYLGFLVDAKVNIVGAKICDIGCATGSFISILPKVTDAYGLDISKFAIDECKQKFPVISNHFLLCNINKAMPDLPVKLDLVTMFDIIEHLDNFGFLKAFLQKYLKIGGHFLITTPNANSLLRFGGLSHTGEQDSTHTALFTPYTLDFWLRRAGFSRVALFTPYSFHFQNNFFTRKILLGGQICAIYERIK